MTLSNPQTTDNHHGRNVQVPQWAWSLMIGFLYISIVCGVLSIIVVVGLAVTISFQANQIRRTQIKNTDRFERVVDEARKEGVLNLPPPPEKREDK